MNLLFISCEIVATFGISWDRPPLSDQLRVAAPTAPCRRLPATRNDLSPASAESDYPGELCPVSAGGSGGRWGAVSLPLADAGHGCGQDPSWLGPPRSAAAGQRDGQSTVSCGGRLSGCAGAVQSAPTLCQLAGPLDVPSFRRSVARATAKRNPPV